MYSFMALIVVIVVGVTAGISYLIADYFFKIKEQELAQKGALAIGTAEGRRPSIQAEISPAIFCFCPPPHTPTPSRRKNR